MRKKMIYNQAALKLLLILPLLGALSLYFSDVANAQPSNSSLESQLEQQPVEVPFAVVEEVPLFPGCEGLSNRGEQKECTTNKINAFVNKNFDLSLPKKLGITGHTRVMVRFKINPAGEVVAVEGGGPYPELSAEGERVVKNLPEMLPGKQRGEPVTVLYTVPIALNVPQ